MKGKGLVLPDRLPIPNPTEDDAGVWQALRINEKVRILDAASSICDRDNGSQRHYISPPVLSRIVTNTR